MIRSLLPEVCQAGINISFDDAGKTVEDVASRLFGSKPMTGATWKQETISGAGLLRKKGEAAPGAFDQITRGLAIEIKPDAYELGFWISREMLEDNVVNLWKQMATFLGISEKESLQYSAALFLGRGMGATVAGESWPTNSSTTNTSSATQTYVGADGLSLFSASHVIEGYAATWGGLSLPSSYSNLNNVAFTETGVQTSIQRLDGMPNMRGLASKHKAKGIVVPSALRFNLNQLLHSQSTTTSTQANPYSSGVANLLASEDLRDGSFAWNHMLDPNDWFVYASGIKDELFRGERDMDSPLEYDYDTNKKVHTVDIFRRWAHAATANAPREIVGSIA